VSAPGSDPEALLEAARFGERVALARVLSIVERGGEPSRAVARLAYRAPVPYSVGLTGAPGSGKSTLTDRLIGAAQEGWPRRGAPGPEAVAQIGVLAVDPSSPFTGGAILGDRVRMQDHATDPRVFIRSMATRGHLGGLTLAVPDAVRVLGAAGLALVLIETVGVGQMEVDVASAADTTIVVVTPGWGDSIQAAKAGLLEVADLFVVNKADRPGVREAVRDLNQMLDLAPPGEWRPPVVETVATTGQGVEGLWTQIAAHRALLVDKGLLEVRRAARLERELRRVLRVRLDEEVTRLGEGHRFEAQLARVVAGEIDPYEAADALLVAELGGRAGTAE
jgi:LAO/AO transport system kinase